MKEVQIKDKLNLTIEETAAYSNIGINKLRELMNMPRCPFVMYIGRKRLIKRREFEKFIESQIVNRFMWKYKALYGNI